MPDATPTYRGYRKQALYILWRILSNDDENIVFAPEDIEDLAIYKIENIQEKEKRSLLSSSKLVLQELIQVKDLSENLTLSDFSPKQNDSFFKRVYRESKSKKIDITIANYGNVGPELEGAIQERDGNKENLVAKKLEGCGFISLNDAKQLLKNINITVVEEKTLHADIIKKLSNGPASPDPDIAIELLLKWISDCSEKKKQVKNKDLIAQIARVGKFISERASHCQEWGTTISSLDTNPTPSSASETGIKKSYREGVDAKLSHIKLGCDVPRITYLNDINNAFKKSNVVILHGNSGQGKSTIAYRYLYEHHPLPLCYEVENVQNSTHAIRIATAISGYAKGISSIVVFIDVKAKFSDWDLLLEKLSQIDNIKVLVSVREEDLRIANISKASVRYEDISLQFGKNEASSLFQNFPIEEIKENIISFDDAWEKFGGKGPLLEFVYLITQGGLLKERLQNQINRIQNDIDSGKRNSRDLDLLRIVSVASEFGGTCSDVLLEKLGFAQNGTVIKKLEDEYLVKHSEGILSGLHRVRSAIISEILCDNRSTKGDAALEALEFISQEKLYIFLLNVFSKCTDKRGEFLFLIDNYPIKNWTIASSILNALLWLGIREYIDENSTLFQEVRQRYKISPTWILDVNITGEKDFGENMLSLCKSFHSDNNEAESEMKSYLVRKTNKRNIFLRAKHWLEASNFTEILPQTASDWSGLGQVYFWSTKVKIKNFPVKRIIPLLSKEIKELPLEIVGDVILGLHFYLGNDFDELLSQHTSTLKKRFQEETTSVKFIDDNNHIEIAYIIKLDDMIQHSEKQSNKSGNFLNNESMYRIELLRKLFPSKERYTASAYGFKLLNLYDNKAFENLDSSQKNIQLENLPIAWEVNLNAIYRNLIDYPIRPPDWSEYIRQLSVQRVYVKDLSETLMNILHDFFSQKDYFNPFEKYANGNLLDRPIAGFKKDIYLPKCALDEWGFTSEVNRQDDNKKEKDSICLAHNIITFNEFYNEYCRTWENFSGQFIQGLVYAQGMRLYDKLHSVDNKKIISDNEHNAKLSLFNLKDFLKNLPIFKKQYNQLFEERFISEESMLHHGELEKIKELWGAWHTLINHPLRKISNLQCHIKNMPNVFEKFIIRFKKRLNKQIFKKIRFYFNHDVQWNDKGALWLIIDVEDLEEINGLIENINEILPQLLCELCPENGILRSMIEIDFPNVGVIFQIKGYMLQSQATIYPTTSLLSKENDELPVSLRLEAIPESVRNELGVDVIDTAPIKWSQNFIEANYNCYAFLTHLAHIAKVNDISDDEIGLEIAQEYINEYLSKNNYLQDILDKATQLLEYCNGFDEPSKDNPSVVKAIAGIQEWYSLGILPYWQGSDEGYVEREMTLDSIAKWSEGYKEAFRTANVAAMYAMEAEIINHQNNLS